MAARTGMANIISTLRAWTEAGTADYTVSGTTYWSDEQLEDVLDRYRIDYYDEPLAIEARTVSGGTAVYYDYYAPQGYWEEATGGTAVWQVQDSTGTDPGTANYTVNYESGHIRFTADTGGASYYLTARRYDVHRAAAEVWRRKAANVANRADWSSDNHSVKASQVRQSYLQMASYYEKQAPARVVRLFRGDLNGS